MNAQKRTQTTTSVAAVQTLAEELKELYRSNGLVIHPQSNLAKLVEDANDLTASNAGGATLRERAFSAIQLNRIALAALPLGISTTAKKYLRRLLQGSVNPLSRDRSIAKDALWELVLWQQFAGMDVDATLEEPDIVANFDGNRVGIACKKIYSERGVEKVISNAVHQIKCCGDFGIVALNLDDLLPANPHLQYGSIIQVATKLHEMQVDFAHRHNRYIRKYLASGRAIAVWFSMSMLTDIESVAQRFSINRQSLSWTIPGL